MEYLLKNSAQELLQSGSGNDVVNDGQEDSL